MAHRSLVDEEQFLLQRLQKVRSQLQGLHQQQQQMLQKLGVQQLQHQLLQMETQQQLLDMSASRGSSQSDVAAMGQFRGSGRTEPLAHGGVPGALPPPQQQQSTATAAAAWRQGGFSESGSRLSSGSSLTGSEAAGVQQPVAPTPGTHFAPAESMSLGTSQTVSTVGSVPRGDGDGWQGMQDPSQENIWRFDRGAAPFPQGGLPGWFTADAQTLQTQRSRSGSTRAGAVRTLQLPSTTPGGAGESGRYLPGTSSDISREGRDSSHS